MSGDSGDTPSLSEVLEAAAEGYINGIRTGLPGQVLSYDSDSHRATVQVQVLEAEFGESGDRVTKTIVIPDVPVAHLGFGSIRIKIPVTKGAQCWLSFSSSCLVAFKQAGRLADPQDDRHHHIADVIVEPWSTVAMQDDAAMIEFSVDGLVKIGGDEPLVKRSEFLGHTHATAGTGTPSPPITGTPGSSATFPGTSKLRG